MQKALRANPASNARESYTYAIGANASEETAPPGASSGPEAKVRLQLCFHVETRGFTLATRRRLHTTPADTAAPAHGQNRVVSQRRPRPSGRPHGVCLRAADGQSGHRGVICCAQGGSAPGRAGRRRLADRRRVAILFSRRVTFLRDARCKVVV